ncbi:hypothetical protein BDZ45DRAFT_744676 [Acephala macrosclerotiorum]|nr:hypothetical protein BDZ45DRAFT_744676 [Acephala macrosclerotiorum]
MASRLWAGTNLTTPLLNLIIILMHHSLNQRQQRETLIILMSLLINLTPILLLLHEKVLKRRREKDTGFGKQPRPLSTQESGPSFVKTFSFDAGDYRYGGTPAAINPTYSHEVKWAPPPARIRGTSLPSSSRSWEELWREQKNRGDVTAIEYNK